MNYVAPPTFLPGMMVDQDDLNALSDNISGGLWRPLAETVVSGSAVASIDWTSIPATFRSLCIVAQVRSTAITGLANLLMRLNNSSSAIYYHETTYSLGATPTAGESLGTTSCLCGLTPGASSSSVNHASVHVIWVPDYAGTDWFKSMHAESAARHNTVGSTMYVQQVYAQWASLAAVNRVTLLMSSGNIEIGSVATLYGVPY